jgi:hypothetical protein
MHENKILKSNKNIKEIQILVHSTNAFSWNMNIDQENFDKSIRIKYNSQREKVNEKEP